MKKRLKLITCLSLITCLFIGQISTVFASQDNDNVDITTKFEGKKVIRSAKLTPYENDDSYGTDKDAKDKVKKSKVILKNLGYSDDEVDAIGDNKIYDKIKDATTIKVAIDYLMVDANGETYPVDEKTCLNESYKINHPDETISSYSNYAYNTNYSPDGYMKITTESIYLNSGYYILTSTYTWLTMPSYRMIDAISLAAPDVAFTTLSGDQYSYCTYKYKLAATGSTIYTETGSGSVVPASSGLYATYDLMDDLYSTGPVRTVTYMSFVVSARARVKLYTSPQVFSVFSQYEHVYSSFNIQPGFSWYPLGISASINAFNNKTSYYGSNYTSYTP